MIQASKNHSALNFIVRRNSKLLFSSMKKYSGLKSQKRMMILTSFNKNLSFSYSGLVNKTFYQFSKTNSYVEHYYKIQTEIKQKKQKVIQLQENIQMLEKMSEMTTKDQILKLLFSIFDKTYQTSAYKHFKEILIDLRNVLEKRIEESSIKWQEPRKLILEEREKRINDFLEKIIQYEGKLAEFIKKRQNMTAQHLADINEGLVLTHKLLIKNIEKQGGIQIWPSKDENFDLNKHEIVGGTSKKQQNPLIQSVEIAGWDIKGNIVRKAKVTIK